jgi:hypothetical protein
MKKRTKYNCVILYAVDKELNVTKVLYGFAEAAEYLQLPINTVRSRTYRYERHWRLKTITILTKDQYRKLINKEVERIMGAIEIRRIEVRRLRELLNGCTNE